MWIFYKFYEIKNRSSGWFFYLVSLKVCVNDFFILVLIAKSETKFTVGNLYPAVEYVALESAINIFWLDYYSFGKVL